MIKGLAIPMSIVLILASACKSSSPTSPPSVPMTSPPAVAAPAIKALQQVGVQNCLTTSKPHVNVLYRYTIENASSWEILVDGKSVGLTGTVTDQTSKASESVPLPCDSAMKHTVMLKVTNDAGSAETSVTVVTRPCQGDSCGTAASPSPSPTPSNAVAVTRFDVSPTTIDCTAPNPAITARYATTNATSVEFTINGQSPGMGAGYDPAGGTAHLPFPCHPHNNAGRHVTYTITASGKHGTTATKSVTVTASA